MTNFILNWKMFGNKKAIKDFVTSISGIFQKDEFCIFCPPIIYTDYLKSLNLENDNLKIAVQNFSHKNEFNNTGEISIQMLKDLNIEYAIVGHSEVRKNFQDSKEILIQKLKLLLEYNLIPIFCFGEEVFCKNKNELKNFVSRELNEIKDLILKFNKFYLCYEPVWAIGKGHIDNYETIIFVLEILKEFKYLNSLDNLEINYGGSVNIESLKELSKYKQIFSGYMIGSASYSLDNFLQILKYERK